MYLEKRMLEMYLEYQEKEHTDVPANTDSTPAWSYEGLTKGLLTYLDGNVIQCSE